MTRNINPETKGLGKELFGKLGDFLLNRRVETGKKLAIGNLPDPENPGFALSFSLS